jgi:hypothetical protein
MPYSTGNLFDRALSTSTTHVLTRAKAYAALLGAVLTAVLGTVPPHTQLWTVLTLVSAVLTSVATYVVPNADADE